MQLAAGRIPDEATAVKIAESELIRVYGGSVIKSERPISAELSGEMWIVGGTLYCGNGKGRTTMGRVGGVGTVQLSNSDGRVLEIFHTL